MSRYLVPALFLCVTAWAGWYNATHATSKITLPLLEGWLPGLDDDPQAVGERSVQILGLVTFVLFVGAGVDHVRSLRRSP